MATCADDVIWDVIDKQFCSFKVTTAQKDQFCRNEFNVDGICSRKYCPLANSKYATVRNVNGRNYLYMKTAERQHTPKKWWERIRLSKNHAQAIEQIEGHLLYWPDHLIAKCKERTTRLFQVANAERRLALRSDERTYVATAPKVRRREKTRERKALVAAKLERAIEKELLERLKSGAYGDKPLNVDEAVWKKVLHNFDENAQAAQEEEEEEDEESDFEEAEFVEDEDDEELDMEDLEKWLGASDHEEFSELSEASDDDDDDDERPTGPVKKRPHVEIEYENVVDTQS